MNTLVIESAPTVFRWAYDEASTLEPEVISGHLLTRRLKPTTEEWIWTRGDERLTAFEDESVTVAEIWKELLDSPFDVHRNVVLLIQALSANLGSKGDVGRIVFLVPERTPEITQDALITELSSRFRLARNEVFLLWRTVALALSEKPAPVQETRRVVVDTGHYCSEGSFLEIALSGGMHCPVREFTRTRAEGPLHSDSLCNWVGRNYSLAALDEFPGTLAEHQTYESLQGDLNFDPPRAWKNEGLFYSPVALAHDEFAAPVKLDPLLDPFAAFIANQELGAGDKILWYGWPVYWHGEQTLCQNFSRSILLEPEAAIRGGLAFARRYRSGQPTYFEQLPGYEIWCLASELGLPKGWRWETLLEPKLIPGTDTQKAKPNERFELVYGTDRFDMRVRLGGSNRYRFVTQSLPVQVAKNTPIVIHSEIRPTGGSVKIALRAKYDPDLFGQNAEVALRWNRAEERSISDINEPSGSQKYSYPFIILSDGNSEKRLELENIASAVSDGESVSNYVTALESLIVPRLGSKWKLGNNFVTPFGNRKVSGHLSREIDLLIDRINDYAKWQIANVTGPDKDAWKWVRIVGSLFHYASEDVQSAFFSEVMEREFPLDDYKVSSLFWSFGRTCREPEQLEDYLKKTLSDWKDLAGMHYWLFWPFAKSLSSYGRTATISREIALEVFECASQMLGWLIAKKVPSSKGAFGKGNWKKWTLSAILFGLRVREVVPDFLSLSEGPARETNLASTLKEQLMAPEILATPIPPLALAGIDVGPNPPTLGELVRRFLEAKASDEDLKLAGGIGLIS